MILYDENGILLSDNDKEAFMNQWILEGIHKPRTTEFKDGQKILSSSDILKLETQWAEHNRQRTTEEMDAEKTIEADIEKQFGGTLKAFALVVLDEINLLRTQAGLQPRTVAQLKNAVKGKL